MPCKLLFIGLDSASPALIRRWAASGDLPVLSNLLASGRSARVLNPTGFLSSISLWPTFFTGSSPASHGFGAYRQIVNNTYTTRPLSPDDIKGENLWTAVSDAGKRVAVIDIPSAPLAQGLNGIQVNEWLTHDAFVGVNTYPPDLKEELIASHGHDPVGHCDFGGNGPPDYNDFIAGLQNRIDTRTSFVTGLLQQHDWDLFMIGLSEPHCVGHQCWHLHDPTYPRLGAASADMPDDPVKTVYRALDHAIACVIDSAPEALVFIYTSHGMGACFNASAGFDQILRRLEGDRPSKPGIAGGMAPYLRSRVPFQFHGILKKPALMLKNLACRLNWRRRKFFAVPSSYGGCSCIRFNLSGREPQGMIAPGEDLEREINALTSKLYRLRETSSGDPVVSRVLRTNEALGSDIPMDFPDLLVEWADKFPIQSVSSDEFSEAVSIATTNRSGDHRPEGLLLISGNTDAIPKWKMPRTLDVTQIAPTIAAYFGIKGFGVGKPFTTHE